MAPAKAGFNQIHLYLFDPDGRPADIAESVTLDLSLPAADLAEQLAKYPNAEVVIVQDEPKNQGAWPFLALNLPEALEALGEHRVPTVVCRPASASPATGSTKKHQIEQADLIARAFDR